MIMVDDLDKPPKTNKTLKRAYERIYTTGEKQYFSKYQGEIDRSETNQYVLNATNWHGKTVVDVGCGTGELLRRIAERGASRLIGVDYSEKAIEIAQSQDALEDISYVAGDFLSLPPQQLDVVVSCGTIEHSDEPDVFLKNLSAWCRDGGMIIITCPHFINIRGFVWMALATLQDIPMSLTDLHFIHPWQVRKWCDALGLEVRELKTFDHERGNGELLLDDYRKRLHNALRDAGLETRGVPEYMSYLEDLVAYMQAEHAGSLEGATAMYVIEQVSRGD